jgi:hypothetical protein
MGMSGGPEAVAEALAATLVAHVNEAVAILNAEANDGTPVPTIAAGNIYALHRSLVPEYPALVVTPVAGHEIGNGAPSWGEVDHHLDVTVLCQSDDNLVLDRQIARYLWAIWRTIKVYQGLDGSLSGLAGIDTPAYGRSQVYKSSENSSLMMQDAGWEVIVHLIESTF